MKKVLVILANVFLIIILVFVSLYFVFKSITKNNLQDKLQILNNNWIELLKLQDEKNDFLKILIKNSSPNIHYVDSLNINLIEYAKNRKNVTECNSNLVYGQYLSNKYMLPIINFYSENSELGEVEKKKALENVRDNIERLNRAIEKYNSSVRDYNLYYTSFPNFIIAKSYGFKRKNYFEIQYGVENIDPKKVKKERREKLRKIEIEHGLSE